MQRKRNEFFPWVAACLYMSISINTMAFAGERKESAVSTVMGTNVSVQVYGSDGIAKSLLDMLADLENKYLSWRVETSDIACLNASAGNKNGYQVQEKTGYYLSQALELSEKSDGAFDITVGTLSRLWGLGTPEARVPDQKEIKERLSGVGYEKIIMEGNLIRMEKGTSVDLGAAGKGIGCQEAEEILKETDAAGAVAAIGGSILLYGEKPDGDMWKIGIANPRNETGDSYLGTLTLEGTVTVSTSGDYEKFLIKNGKRYHHILDPHTGFPAESGLISVTVVSREGWLSDALSTACFVLGYEKSLDLLEQYGAQAVFVDENYRVCVTDGLADAFTITGAAYEMVDEL